MEKKQNNIHFLVIKWTEQRVREASFSRAVDDGVGARLQFTFPTPNIALRATERVRELQVGKYMCTIWIYMLWFVYIWGRAEFAGAYMWKKTLQGVVI